MKKNTKDNEIEIPKLKNIYNTIVNTAVISVDTIKKNLDNIDKKKKNYFLIILIPVITTKNTKRNIF